MSYIKQTWADGAGGGTPLSAPRLQHMEDGIDDADIRLDAVESSVAGKASQAALDALAVTDLADYDNTTPPTSGQVPAWNGTAWAPATVAAGSSDRFYVPSAQLAFTQVGTVAYTPTSVGTDGLAYGALSEASTTLIRSADGFATIDTGADLAAAGAPDPIIWAGRVAEGYIAVTSNGEAGSPTRGAMWFSTSWSTGWTKTQDLTAGLGTARIAVGRPEFDSVTGKTLWGVGEYTQQAGVNHHLWLSRDGGQTWVDSFSRAAVDATANNHMHAWAYDPAIRRMWLSHGDGKNSYFAYSDDLGSTWTSIPAYGMPVATVNPPTSWHQPPILIAGEKFLITSPDAGDNGTNFSAVWTVDKSPAGAVTEALRVTNVEGYKQYSASPYAMSTDRRRIYMVFPQSPTLGTTNQVFVAASGDGGRSWALVHTAASVLGDSYSTGIVGPDAAGRLYLSPKPNGAGARILLRATEPTWVSTVVGQHASSTSDIKAALAQAGIIAPGGASPLNLQGGRVTAGSARLDGASATLTMGSGAADVAIFDTPSGTSQQRFRIAGTEVFRTDVNTLMVVPGKKISFGITGQPPSIQTGTGTPEGVITAAVGALYLRIDGGAGTSLYVKESGSASTGWARFTTTAP